MCLPTHGQIHVPDMDIFLGFILFFIQWLDIFFGGNRYGFTEKNSECHFCWERKTFCTKGTAIPWNPFKLYFLFWNHTLYSWSQKCIYSWIRRLIYTMGKMIYCYLIANIDLFIFSLLVIETVTFIQKSREKLISK